tara:strand:+ start:252 stop:929 length:678 start_codon:yes stop_codon:yes gene_type:complete
MKSLPAVTFLFFIILISCNKDDNQPNLETDPNPVIAEVVDTIFPSSFFPAYPGSYWNYSDGTNYTIDPSYSIKQYYDYNQWPNPNLPAPGGDFTNYYVPILRINGGTDIGVYNYSTIPYSGSSTYEPDVFYKESVNNWEVAGHWSTTKSYVVLSRDTSIMINGNLMDSLTCVREFQSPGGGSSGAEIYGIYKFYAEDIGLVRKDWRDPSDSSILYMDLIDYYINN